MRTIIIEDEKPAAEKLMKSIGKADPSIDVLTLCNSIQQAVEWLEKNPMPDLIFMDIELSDGMSFRIFEKVNITCPVIFTTAYDEYWQQAFENNSIDYLLKPIKQDKLEAALGKYELLKKYFSQQLQQLLDPEKSQQEGYKKRFLIKRGADYFSVKTDDIRYFFATHKIVCLVDDRSQKFIVDQSLNEIEKQLDPLHFYRVNRKYIVHINAIKKIKTYPKSKLQLELEPHNNDEIIISQENVASFKQWMGN
ncbi:MAG TPA: LytTR family DNA-binding domain-containing protein [Chitinophagaceae bacterium]